MINEALYSSNSPEWRTPTKLIQWIVDFWGPFETDLAATEENSLCDFYVDKKMDALTIPWYGNCWLNPPYGRQIGKWVKKAYESVIIDKTATKIVMLIPARTDTRYFHDYIWDEYTRKPKEGVTIHFIKGRLKFSESKNSAPFPSMIVRFKLK